VNDLGFEHVFRQPSDPAAPTLLLLHGTGGTEHDLVPLASLIAPAAGVLSPRGKVLEGPMSRFFRRLSEGVFDLDDLRFRSHELAGFVEAAAARYGFDAKNVIAVGFSNGANIAAGLLLLSPRVLSAAVLFRAMSSLVPEPLPALAGTRVLMSNGRGDVLVPATRAEALADLLRRCGADVTLEWQPGGHSLTKRDVEAAVRFLKSA
jgi:phospholipase/carboxylesterase/glyoxalase family protein